MLAVVFLYKGQRLLGRVIDKEGGCYFVKSGDTIYCIASSNIIYRKRKEFNFV